MYASAVSTPSGERWICTLTPGTPPIASESVTMNSGFDE
ncbi:Uncharacterised protein [Mycobacterium tuberculosis]|nr:Uncharacterised protein [Mycobacterium tuberculosis]